MESTVIQDMAKAGFVIVPTLAGLLLLLLDLLPGSRRSEGSFSLGFLGAASSFVYTAVFLYNSKGGLAFDGTLDIDHMALIGGLVIHGSALLATLLAKLYLDRRPDVDQTEFYALIQFSAAGMAMLACANDLICVFLGVEILSVPLYILAAMRLKNERSVEAGMKYLLLGAFASAFLLFGMALWYASAGTTSISGLAPEIVRYGTGGGHGLAALGATFFLVGLLFKVGAVPFHMWTPDVYEGSPTPVTAFMATATKAAVLVALLRSVPAIAESFGSAAAAKLIGGIAILTMIVGNLGALRQENLKRLLAWSSIAHAGYMLVGVAAACATHRQGSAVDASSAVLYYLAVYAVMNLGAFAVALVADRGLDRERVSDLAGLGRERPFLAASMAVFALALAGLPPTAGFMGKLYLFQAAVSAGEVGLAVAGVLASVIGLFYYLRLLLVMYGQPAVEGSVAPRGDALLAIVSAAALLVTLWFGVSPSWFMGVVG